MKFSSLQFRQGCLVTGNTVYKTTIFKAQAFNLILLKMWSDIYKEKNKYYSETIIYVLCSYIDN